MWKLKILEKCEAPAENAKQATWYRYEIESTHSDPIVGFSCSRRQSIERSLRSKIKRLNDNLKGVSREFSINNKVAQR